MNHLVSMAPQVVLLALKNLMMLLVKDAFPPLVLVRIPPDQLKKNN
jgi:hypothetical protein